MKLISISRRPKKKEEKKKTQKREQKKLTLPDAKTVRWIAVAGVSLLLVAALIIAIVLIISASDNDSRLAAVRDAVLSAREPIELKLASLEAMQYDYDSALARIEPFSSEAANELRSDIESEKQGLVAADNYAIPHIFFHSLIADTSKAFDGEYTEAGYNQVMTTIAEFNEMMRQMYERGYVLISLHDIAEVNPDGTVTEKQIMLPPEKKPFVLSVDDVCYYEYMDGDGFASRIVIGEDGKPTCEMKQDDGSIITGDFDVVPLLDKFVEEHPDFSYRGAKGILALTGYNGVLGYRTCPSYSDNPTYNDDVEAAKAVAQNLREHGWEFASHSWGHRNMGTISMENLRTDTQRWEDEVETIIGDTDILIYPFGADISGVKKYTEANERFVLLKSVGFDYFCNVDGNRAWLQIGKNYVRQGRRNLDGYRMYYDMINDKRDWLSDLFDVNTVFDKCRPLPVPPMG